VVGATYPAEIERVRAPTLPLLIPGVVALGGDAAVTVKSTGGPVRPSSGTHRAPLFMHCRVKILPRRRGVKPSGRGMCCKQREAEVSRRTFFRHVGRKPRRAGQLTGMGRRSGYPGFMRLAFLPVF